MSDAKLCPKCDGDGVVPLVPRGRPTGDGRAAFLLRGHWKFCPQCDARGWVYLRPGRRKGKRASRHGQVQDRRGVEFYQRWRDGESQPAIAASLDPPLTRERVRQLIYRDTPKWLIDLTHRLHAARSRQRDFVANGALPITRDCWVCGTPTIGDGRITTWATCPRHRDRADTGYISNALKLVCNIDGRHDRHREAPSQARHRTTGNGANHGMRWLIRGSKTDLAIREAIEKGWPLVEYLPPEVVASALANAAADG